MDYALHILILICLYGCLAMTLDMLFGHTGMLSLAHAAFYGIGAYTTAILTTQFGANMLLSTITGAAIAGICAIVVVIPALRLKGEQLVIVTFALQIVAYDIFNNWAKLTGGAKGISNIPTPQIASWKVDSQVEFLTLAVILTVIILMAYFRLTSGALGRVLHAIRENENFARALGRNTNFTKAAMVVIACSLAAICGSLFATYQRFIDPTSFTIMESVLILSMVLLGGPARLWGSLVGATILVLIPEVLRELGATGALAANIRQILIGLLLVLVMIYHPSAYRTKAAI